MGVGVGVALSTVRSDGECECEWVRVCSLHRAVVPLQLADVPVLVLLAGHHCKVYRFINTFILVYLRVDRKIRLEGPC